MEAWQIHSGLGHQRRQPGDEVQRLENDVGGAVAIGRLELALGSQSGRSATAIRRVVERHAHVST